MRGILAGFMLAVALLLVPLLVLLLVMPARAQTVTYYGPSGQYAGTSSTIGTTTQFYGANGQWLGSANRFGPMMYQAPPMFAPQVPMLPWMPMPPMPGWR